MGDLTGKRIDQTYDGLIKTNDEQPIDGTLKALQDGVGNNLPVQVSTGAVNFTGTVTGDNNTTYDINTTQDGTNVVLELQPDTGGSIDVNFIPGSNVTLTTPSNKNIVIAATGGGGTPVTYTIAATQATPTTVAVTLSGSDGSSDTVTLSAGGNVSISTVNDVITFSSTDTNTTYDLTSAQNNADVDITLTPSIGQADTVTLAAGTNITLTDNGAGNITIDAAGGGGGTDFGTAYQNVINNTGMGGYPSTTFARFVQPIVGRPGMFQAIDQNDDALLFMKVYAEPGTVINEVIIPLFPHGGTAVEVSLFNAGPVTAQPYTRISTTVLPVAANTADEFVRVPLTAPYTILDSTGIWIGIRTSNNAKVAQIGGDNAIHTWHTWGAFGGAIGSILAVNTLYFSGATPNTITEPYPWSFREEVTVMWFR